MAEQKPFFDDDFDDTPSAAVDPSAVASGEVFEDEPFDSPPAESIGEGEDAEEFTAPPTQEELKPPPALACPPKETETMKKAVNPHKSTTAPAKRGRPKGTGGRGMIQPPSPASEARNAAKKATGTKRRGRPPKAAQPTITAENVTSAPVATPQPAVKTRKRRTKATVSGNGALNVDQFTRSISKAIEKQTKPVEKKLAKARILIEKALQILVG